jgi:ergothioneine biosynthesis protein EgtB
LLEGKVSPELAELVELGLQHEQQHQELLLTDIKHLLACNPLQPVYAPRWPPTVGPASASAPEHESSFTCGTVVAAPLDWVQYSAGLTQIGHSGTGFAFDNESPRHSVMLGAFALASRLVTHGEWLAFMDAGGYRDPRWWMSAGWDWVRAQQAQAPLYWQPDAQAGWSLFTLHGRVPIDPHTPVVHISWFEADAFARWSAERLGLPVRLPTEAEWEHAAQSLEGGLQRYGNFAESGALHPMPVAHQGKGPLQVGGDVWEWTGSSYLPYPGYVPWAGAVGEYNGKFMVNQMVLRGGSCVTPSSHIRPSYRNFFPTDARWQFTGLRLAYSLSA